MAVKCKDGKEFTEEMQSNASLIYVKTPNGNIIVVNDALMNAQSMLISEEDFAPMKELHATGGEIVELAFDSELVSGEFNDNANPLGFSAKMELIEDPFDDIHVGTMMFIDKNIETRYTLVVHNIDEKTVEYLLINAFDLTVMSISPDIEDKLYRIVIKHDDPAAANFIDVFKAVALDTGPIRCMREDNDEEKED